MSGCKESNSVQIWLVGFRSNYRMANHIVLITLSQWLLNLILPSEQTCDDSGEGQLPLTGRDLQQSQALYEQQYATEKSNKATSPQNTQHLHQVFLTER